MKKLSAENKWLPTLEILNTLLKRIAAVRLRMRKAEEQYSGQSYACSLCTMPVLSDFIWNGASPDMNFTWVNVSYAKKKNCTWRFCTERQIIVLWVCFPPEEIPSRYQNEILNDW